MFRRKMTAVIATTLLTALTLTACSDDESSDDTAARSTTTSDQNDVSTDVLAPEATETPESPSYAITGEQDDSSWSEVHEQVTPNTYAYTVDPNLQRAIRDGGFGEYDETRIFVNRLADLDQPVEIYGWQNGNAGFTDVALQITDSDFVNQPWAERVQTLDVDEYVLVDEQLGGELISEEEILAYATKRSPNAGSIAPQQMGVSIDWMPDHVANGGLRDLFGRERTGDMNELIPSNSDDVEWGRSEPIYNFRYWIVVVPDPS
ncbi:MAG: hypothetical protein ACTJG2_01580 [Candidatus Saccharimonadales bacterium]